MEAHEQPSPSSSRYGRISRSLPSRQADIDESTPLLFNNQFATMKTIVSRGNDNSLSDGSTSYTVPYSHPITIRMIAICPNIHCPSCISHLSQLASTLKVNPSFRLRLDNVAVSLIDRSVKIDVLLDCLQPVSECSPKLRNRQEAIQRKTIKTVMKNVANILSEDGFPIDSIQAKLIDPTFPSPSSPPPNQSGVSIPISRSAQRFQHESSLLEFILDSQDVYNLSSKPSYTQKVDGPVPMDGSIPVSSSTVFSTLSTSLSAALNPWAAWKQSQLKQQERQRWLKHVQFCQACSQGATHGITDTWADVPHPDVTLNPSSLKPNPESQDDTFVSTQLAIGGMTCASCLNSIHRAIDALKSSMKEASSDIKEFQINLLSNSATLISKPSVIDKVVEAIEDCGFDAEILKTENLRKPTARLPEAGSKSTSKKWKASLSISGITCSSCVNSINGAIEAVKKQTDDSSNLVIADYQISILDGIATIALQTLSNVNQAEVRTKLQDIQLAINDCGFDAQVVNIDEIPNQTKGLSKNPTRNVRIRVEGMFCGHCVSKVRHFFHDTRTSHPDLIELADEDLDSFSLEKPFVSFTYSSSATSPVTLRSILKQINHLDPSFDARYSPPPSLSSRSAALARKELKHLVMRLIICFLFAIPTLVISMVAPMTPKDHPLNRRFSRKVWGGASLGEVVMLFIATPVQFGVGSIFFKRAYKSIASVWKKGRSWNERLFRFGNMDVLVALGTLVAYLSSLVFLFIDVARGSSGRTSTEKQDSEMGMSYFEVSVFLIFFILLGRVMESISKKKTGDAVAELGKMKPTSAQLILDSSRPAQSQTQMIQVELLEIGDLVLIPSGASPPLDATLVATGKNAHGLFDESSLSGEARPVIKKDGDSVFSGTANASPYPIVAQVAVLPGQSMIDDILDVVRDASGRKANIEQLADTITGIFVPCVVYLSVFVWILWIVLLYSGILSERWIQQNTPHYGESGAKFLMALQFAISCLLISCPCAIGLAAPTSQLAGIGLASQQGILVNGGGEAFRSASAAARGQKNFTVIFDKTGTITKGEEGKVVDSISIETESQAWLDRATLLHCIDLAEQSSSHPLGISIRSFCQQQLQHGGNQGKNSSQIHLNDVAEQAGKGLTAQFTFSNQAETIHFDLLIGNRSLMQASQAGISKELEEKASEWQEAAKSVVYAAVQIRQLPSGEVRHGLLRSAFAISDTIRPEAKWTIDYLRQVYKTEVWMISGDNERTARAVAKEVGIPPSHVVAGVLPNEKKDWVENLQNGRQTEVTQTERRKNLVCFVGDGINDSPAIASSDLGIALGSGSSIAHSSADFILLQKSCPLLLIPILISLSKATNFKILSNFAWAFVFNVSLIPIAAGILMPLGFQLGPELSGLAMACSSTSVVLNSLSLRLWRPPKKVAEQMKSLLSN